MLVNDSCLVHPFFFLYRRVDANEKEVESNGKILRTERRMISTTDCTMRSNVLVYS